MKNTSLYFVFFLPGYHSSLVSEHINGYYSLDFFVSCSGTVVLLVELETFNLSLDLCNNGTATSSLSLTNMVVADGAGLQLLGSSDPTAATPGCPRATDQSGHISSRNSSRTDEGRNSSSVHSSRVSSRTNTREEEEKHAHIGDVSEQNVNTGDENDKGADDASTLSNNSVGPAPLLQVSYHCNAMDSAVSGSFLPREKTVFSHSLHVEAQPLDAVFTQTAVLQLLLFTDEVKLPNHEQEPSTTDDVVEDDSWNPPPSIQPGTPGSPMPYASSLSNSSTSSTSNNAVDTAALKVSDLPNVSLSLHLGKIGVSAANDTTGELFATLNFQDIDASMSTIPGRAKATLSLGNAQLWHISPDSSNELLGRWDPWLLRQGDAYESSDNDGCNSDNDNGSVGSNIDPDSDSGDLHSGGPRDKSTHNGRRKDRSRCQSLQLDQPLITITACVETNTHSRTNNKVETPLLTASAGVKLEPLRLVASAPFALAMQSYVSSGPLMAYFANKAQEQSPNTHVPSSSLPWNASPKFGAETNQLWESGGTSLTISARPNNFSIDEHNNRCVLDAFPLPGNFALRVKLTGNLASPTLLLPTNPDSALSDGLIVDLGDVATTIELEGISCQSNSSSSSSSEERGVNGRTDKTENEAPRTKPQGFLVPSPAPATSSSLPSTMLSESPLPLVIVAKASLHVQGALVRDVSSGGPSLLLPVDLAVLLRMPLSTFVPHLAVDQPIGRAVGTALFRTSPGLKSDHAPVLDPSLDSSLLSSAPQNDGSCISHRISSADLPTEGVSPSAALLVVKVSPVVACLSEATLTLALRATAAVSAALPPLSADVRRGGKEAAADSTTTGASHNLLLKIF